jgi:hypothetical protein
MLSRLLNAQEISGWLTAITAFMVDGVSRRKHYRQIITAYANDHKAFDSLGLTDRQLDKLLGILLPEDPSPTDLPFFLTALQTDLEHRDLSDFLINDPLRQAFATQWIQATLRGEAPEPLQVTLAAKRLDLVSMEFTEALTIVAQCNPTLYAAYTSPRCHPSAAPPSPELPARPKRGYSGSTTSVHNRQQWQATIDRY